MATINSLPPELLLHIIRMAGTSWQKRPCHRTLRVAALVCRSWQRPAQKVLWEDVEIDKAAVLDLFLAWTATLGLFTTRMWLSGGLAGIDGVHAAGVAEALGRFPGLQRLHLFHVADVDYSALCAPHLSGLKHLKFGFSNFAPRPSLAQLPFHLSSLTLHIDKRKGGISAWTKELVVSLLQPSITSLVLTLPSPFSDHNAFRTIFTRPLSTLAPHLTSLDISLFEDPRTNAKLAPFFKRCLALETITTSDSGIFDNLPTPLKVWTSFVDPKRLEDRIERTIAALRTTVALSKLEKLEFQFVGRDNLGGKRLDQLEELSRQMGFELVLGGDDYGLDLW